MTQLRLANVMLGTTDLDRAVRFYHEVLGLDLTGRTGGFAFFEAGGVTLTLSEAHAGLELEAIACVVVGGTLITGGRGATWLSLLGLAVVASLDMGLVSFFKAEARLMVIGALLTLLGNLIADIGYALVDPRVRVGDEG